MMAITPPTAMCPERYDGIRSTIIPTGPPELMALSSIPDISKSDVGPGALM